MPIQDSTRIYSGSGKIGFKAATSGELTGSVSPIGTAYNAPPGATTTTPAGPSPVLQPVVNITARNVGVGSGILAGTHGLTSIVMDLRSLAAGPGINLVQTVDTIQISAAVSVPPAFVTLPDGPGSITPRSVLVGANATLAWSPPATTANTVLTYTGSGFTWLRPAPQGITSVVPADASLAVTTASGIASISLANNGVVPGTYVLPTIVVGADGRISQVSTTPVTSLRFNVGFTLSASGDVVQNSFTGVPAGWSAVWDNPNQVTFVHNLGLFPFAVSVLGYNSLVQQWTKKVPYGSPNTQFSVGINSSGTTPNSFTIYGLSGSAISGSPNTNALISIMM